MKIDPVREQSCIRSRGKNANQRKNHIVSQTVYALDDLAAGNVGRVHGIGRQIAIHDRAIGYFCRGDRAILKVDGGHRVGGKIRIGDRAGGELRRGDRAALNVGGRHGVRGQLGVANRPVRHRAGDGGIQGIR